jgi:hypothetical protein
MGDAALASIERIQRRSLEAGRVAAENKEARSQETQVLGAVQKSLTDWLTAELKKVASVISSGSIKCDVRDATMPKGQHLRVEIGPSSWDHALNGVELTFEDINDPFNRCHALQFFLCKCLKVEVKVTSGHRLPIPQAEPARDFELAVLPMYRQTLRHLHPSNASEMGFINRKANVGTMRSYLAMPPGGRNRGAQLQHRRVNLISTSFENDLISTSFENDVTLRAAFRASGWPGNEEQLRDLLKERLVYRAHQS